MIEQSLGPGLGGGAFLRLRLRRELVPWLGIFEECFPLARELGRASLIQSCRVLRVGRHAQQPRPVADAGVPEPIQNGAAAAVGLDHDVDRLEAIEVPGVPRLVPRGGAWQSYRRKTLEPERQAIGLTLDDRDFTTAAETGDLVEAIQDRLRALLPAELVATADLAPEPHGYFGAAVIDVRNPDRRAIRLTVSEALFHEELDCQIQLRGIALQVALRDRPQCHPHKRISHGLAGASRMALDGDAVVAVPQGERVAAGPVDRARAPPPVPAALAA